MLSPSGASTQQTVPPSDKQYDHAITLVDTTAPKTAPDPDREPDEPPTPSDLTPSSTSTYDPIKRTWTKGTGTLRKQLAQRKYGRYQQERYDAGDDDDLEAGPSNQPSSKPAPGGLRSGIGGIKKNLPWKGKAPRGPKSKEKSEYEVDVLYENQRGAFFCGIPLYSHGSLLNFDPSAWVTKEFKDSAVNITNAQVPDPSWEWVWKTWYVDMSYDVDEEGWQYSFSFSSNFAWHGTHPWFHSFVRRRRWLRKRIRKRGYKAGTGEGTEQPHMLNADYFTIHNKVGRSRDSSQERSTVPRLGSTLDDASVDEEDVQDISALMRRLKRAHVDREKIEIVKDFVQHGGEELYYLEDSIPAIMSMFIFQNSRQQLLGYLLKTVDDASDHRDDHAQRGEAEGKAEKRRIDNLIKAIQAADKEVKNLEFWSDVKQVAHKRSEEDLDTSEQEKLVHDVEASERIEDAQLDGLAEKDEPKTLRGDDRIIAGIPEEAEVGEDKGISFKQSISENDEKGTESQSVEAEKEEKGKGPADTDDKENQPMPEEVGRFDLQTIRVED